MDNTLIITQIEEKLGVHTFPEETKALIVNGLALNVVKRVYMDIIETLNEEGAEVMGQKIEEGDVESILTMLGDKHPELDEKVVKTTEQVIEEFLAAKNAA